MSINGIKRINFNKFSDERGNICFLERGKNISFDIKRIYYIYDIPSGKTRGEHAHKELEQVFIALNGSFKLTLDDGYNKESFILNDPSMGLYIPKMLWRTVDDFSANCICMVLASEIYKADDYYHDYNEFIKDVKKRNEQ